MNAPAQTVCDRTLAMAKPDRPVNVDHPRLVLATTILASSLAFIDGSVVNVGLPAIGASLDAGGDGLSWVVNAYLLPLSALLLIGGAAGDLHGRRRLLVLGVALFALASIVCSLAPSLGWLLAGRGLQGVSAAMLMPNSLAIIGASFAGEARGRAVGVWAAIGAAAGAIGPLIGGWLIDSIGWRAIFFVNLPLAIVAIVFALRYVPRDAHEDRPPLDWPGVALTSAQMGRLATSIGPRLPLSIGPIVVAGGCLLAMRIGGPGNYWTTTFPAMLVIAIGMAAAVAPLTTAVLASVDGKHTGVASGLNSAVARTGGLIATAIAAAVLAARGAELLTMYRVAAVVGSLTAVAAGIIAFVLVRNSADGRTKMAER